MRKEISAITEELLQNRKTSIINEMSGTEFKKKMESNATFKKMSNICKKAGYVLGEAYQERYSDKIVMIHIRIISADPNDYHPDIYFEDNKGKRKFKIQTTSYGSLYIEEYEEFVICIKDAYSLVKELNKIDFSTLELFDYND